MKKAMTQFNFILVLLALCFLILGQQALAQTQLTARIPRNLICATNGQVQTNSAESIEVTTATSRSVVTTPTEQKIRIDFTYLAPINDPAANPNGHRQIGLKLRAANSCNVLYVMWPVAGGPLKVTLKRNDGMKNHSECGPEGYTNLTPSLSKTVSALQIGRKYRLQAEYENETLNVYASGVKAWSGMIENQDIPFQGPVGVRTDGGKFTFDIYTDLSAPLSSERNLPQFESYGCYLARPSIRYRSSSVVLRRNSALTGQLDIRNSGGPIRTCSVSPALPAGLQLDTANCRITGIPQTNQGTTRYLIAATNSAGTYKVYVDIRIMTPPSLHYSSGSYSLKRGAAISLIPVYGGNAVESCRADHSLPAGLVLSNRCVLSGTPTSLSGYSTYVITARNRVGASQTKLTLRVLAPPVLIYAAKSFVLKKGARVSLALRSNGGRGSLPASCAINLALPNGISFNPVSCTISGSAKALQAAKTYQITGRNAVGVGSTSLQLSVVP
ncbi:MAG: Ig domain-containing protein [Pseudobdellovibrionaceae bacterium]